MKTVLHGSLTVLICGAACICLGALPPINVTVLEMSGETIVGRESGTGILK